MKRVLSLFSVVLCLCILSSCRHRNNTVSSGQIPEVSSSSQSVIPDTIHIRYTGPINGYTVAIDVTPEEPEASGPAVITFTKGEVTFSVLIDDVKTDAYELKNIVKDSDNVVLEYVPKPKDSMLYSNELFFFSDVDFDGVEEIIILDYGQGIHGVHAYRVFEPDGTQRTDPPFDKLDNHMLFNIKEKIITMCLAEDDNEILLQVNQVK